MCLQTGWQAPGCGLWKVPVSGGPTYTPEAPAQEQSPSTGPFVRLFMFLKHANSHRVRIKVPWALHVCVLTWQAVNKERTLIYPVELAPRRHGALQARSLHRGPSWRERGQGTPRGHCGFPGLELPWMWACGNPSLTDVWQHWAEGSFWGSPHPAARLRPAEPGLWAPPGSLHLSLGVSLPASPTLGLASIHCPTDVTLFLPGSSQHDKAEPGGWVLYSAAAVPGHLPGPRCVFGGYAPSGTE